MLLKWWVFLENMERYWKKKEFHQELQWTKYYNQKQNLILSFIVGNQKQTHFVLFFPNLRKKCLYIQKKKISGTKSHKFIVCLDELRAIK